MSILMGVRYMVTATQTIYLTWTVVKSPADVTGTFDYIVCANRAIDQDKVVSQLQPAVDESKTTIVIIQNGVGNEETFRKKFPGCSIITCVVGIISKSATELPIYLFRRGQEQLKSVLESLNTGSQRICR